MHPRRGSGIIRAVHTPYRARSVPTTHRVRLVALRLGWPVIATLLATSTGWGCESFSEARRPSTHQGTGQPLIPDELGQVELSTTGSTGIYGRWFASADTEDCQQKGGHSESECSAFITPDPGAASFAPSGDLGMCTVGVAGKVIPNSTGSLDWDSIHGARIGLTLQGGVAYDALVHGVTGFGFRIDSEPPPHALLRVEVSTEASGRDPAWWGGAAAESSPVHAGYNEVRWADVGGPLYLAHPPPFDPSRVLSIAFQVPAGPSGAKSFAFCIGELTALQQ